MTVQELHDHNRTQVTSEMSYQAVCTNDFIIEMRRWMRDWLDKAYDAGFKAANEGTI